MKFYEEILRTLCCVPPFEALELFLRGIFFVLA